MNKTTTDDLRRATFAKATTESLIAALLQLGSDRNPAAETRLVVAWTRTELETRHPAAGKALEEAFQDASDHEDATGQYVDVDYDAILIGAIRKEQSS